MASGYLSEFRGNMRALAAATLGVSVGIALNAYTTAVFAPALIKEFGWTRSQFALVGVAALPAVMLSPFIGALADRFGVRIVAAGGVLLLPLTSIAFSQMTGSFSYYLFIMFLQIGVGMATSVVVYTRIVAERFRKARGLALTIITCGPALLGALAAPSLNFTIEQLGWRGAYRAFAAFILIGGLIALLLIPTSSVASPLAHRRPGFDRKDFRQIFNRPIFWIILVGLVLCNMPAVLHSSQLKLLLQDNGQASSMAAMLMSVYAVSTIFGRILCGLALDRFATHAVAGVSMFMPAVAFLILASNFDATWAIALSMALFGVAQGAEGDLAGYFAAKYFPVRIYGTVLGLISAGMASSATTGSIILSATLGWDDSFTLFLLLLATAVSTGAVLLFSLRGWPAAAPDEAERPMVPTVFAGAKDKAAAQAAE